MGRFTFVAVALVASLAGCKDKKAEGLPPAQEWSANTNTLPAAPQPGRPNANPHGGADPHAGMNMGGGNNPHAGVDMGGAPDPHAGIDMNNPHGGTGAPKMGVPAPDPSRKIDPNNRVTGTIKSHPKAKDRLATGGAVFVMVKKAGADGAAFGPPLAAEKLIWQQSDLKFSLTEAQAMMAGTQLTGDVVVIARYDQDGDASSKQPGDVVGETRVKIPADNVNVTLDDILQ